MQHALSTPFASLIRTPPADGSWNEVLEDDDATVIDARPLDYRVTLNDGETTELLSQLCRRLEERREVEAYLEVGLAPRSESNLVAGFDGLVHGVFVATYRELEVGTLVQVTVCLPGGAELDARARVEWIRDRGCRDGAPGLGLRFVALDPEDDDLLQTFAAYREPLFHDA